MRSAVRRLTANVAPMSSREIPAGSAANIRARRSSRVGGSFRIAIAPIPIQCRSWSHSPQTSLLVCQSRSGSRPRRDIPVLRCGSWPTCSRRSTRSSQITGLPLFHPCVNLNPALMTSFIESMV
jgi:hypothetical protein